MSAGFITLTLEVVPERDLFVSRCLELDVASCGDTMDEALRNVEEATLEYLNAIDRLGERDRIFSERGITIRRTRPRMVRREYELPPGSFAGPYVARISTAA